MDTSSFASVLESSGESGRSSVTSGIPSSAAWACFFCAERCLRSSNAADSCSRSFPRSSPAIFSMRIPRSFSFICSRLLRSVSRSLNRVFNSAAWSGCFRPSVSVTVIVSRPVLALTFCLITSDSV